MPCDAGAAPTGPRIGPLPLRGEVGADDAKVAGGGSAPPSGGTAGARADGDDSCCAVGDAAGGGNAPVERAEPLPLLVATLPLDVAVVAPFVPQGMGRAGVVVVGCCRLGEALTTRGAMFLGRADRVVGSPDAACAGGGKLLVTCMLADRACSADDGGGSEEDIVDGEADGNRGMSPVELDCGSTGAGSTRPLFDGELSEDEDDEAGEAFEIDVPPDVVALTDPDDEDDGEADGDEEQGEEEQEVAEVEELEAE